MKIGNTSFREEAIKKMTLKEFKDSHKHILKGDEAKEVYRKITGRSEKEPDDLTK